jgi:hypothetical protein
MCRSFCFPVLRGCLPSLDCFTLRIVSSLGCMLVLYTITTAPVWAQQAESEKLVKTALNHNSLSGSESILGQLTFLATFDHGLDADFSDGDRRIHTSVDLDRTKSDPGNAIDSVSIAEGEGRFGNAIRFAKKTRQALFYSAEKIGYRAEKWSGTLSVWMKLDPDKDLKPGYCDPILLSDKQWDQSALFVDFDKDLPRDFRLGVFPDYKVWNPAATPWDDIPIQQRPMVVAKQPPFGSDQWTHVCFTWEDANLPDDRPGKATLYLNGKSQGSHSQVMRYTWDNQRAALMLGIYYIGLMDELAVFSVALSQDQVLNLYESSQGLAKSLHEGK